MLNFGLVEEPGGLQRLPPQPCGGSALGGRVPTGPDNEASDSGQYGLAMRYFASELNDTEFGLYYLRYHSRLPYISGTAVTNASTTSGSLLH